jgi:hypothetical protein
MKFLTLSIFLIFTLLTSYAAEKQINHNPKTSTSLIPQENDKLKERNPASTAPIKEKDVYQVGPYDKDGHYQVEIPVSNDAP